ncbi:MAG: NAD(P)/FAD-dependent oxidoreductase [Eubacterium sp.]|nr:NAD(P)/FAD-dependent oxidoreductase [Eubacterium sp.]
MKKKMIVIGGGAAGMMTAIKASDKYEVTIIEKNEKCGKKLFITGKGRCNVTNASDEETFLRNVVTNPKFLYSSIYSYNQSQLMADIEAWGTKLKVERGDRVFPVSDHSSDIIKAFTSELARRRVKIIYNTSVKQIICRPVEAEDITSEKKSAYEKEAVGLVLSGGKRMMADVIVLTTGGRSYPLTGSLGEGYDMVKELGIEVVMPRPALVPLVTKETFVKEIMGLSLKNVSIKLIAGKNEYKGLKKDKILYQEMGEMLFTHFGVSGPLCLSASSYVSNFIAGQCEKDQELKDLFNKSRSFKPIILSIDLKPALSEEVLDKRILRDFEEFSNRELQNALVKLLPKSIIPFVIEMSGVSPCKKASDISLEERKRLLAALKDFRLTVNGLRGFEEAIITGGGISVKEINPQNMELKKVKNLRVAGEIIDVDALTGGFNLQIAWSTAYMAAE